MPGKIRKCSVLEMYQICEVRISATHIYCSVGAMIKKDGFASYSQFLQHFLLAERCIARELGIIHQITRELIYFLVLWVPINKSLSLH